jgi:DNA helicase IV
MTISVNDAEFGAELAAEQYYVTMLYEVLDARRQRAAEQLAAVERESVAAGRSGEVGAEHEQNRGERDAATSRYLGQLARLDAAEHGLCFGRLDLVDGARQYIGRLGLVDNGDDYTPLLVDWRAPAARPFYVATAAFPEGVTRRRHLRTLGRSVTGFHDDVLDRTEAVEDGDQSGDAALLAALDAERTGQLGDIVETIQAEQDAVIRSAHPGVLVVEGGPGTGKTAVALHRAAFLLYTHRERLASHGVLIVGPNPTFLQYIAEVLPALGETGVVLASIADLFPGVKAQRIEPAATAEVKGRAVLAEILALAVTDRQEVPTSERKVPLTGTGGDFVWLEPAACERAREKARAAKRPHNEAREIFVDAMLDALAEQVAARIGHDPFAFESLGGGDATGEENLLEAADVAEIRWDLSQDSGIRVALDPLWPALTPQQLLEDLYASPERLAVAAAALNETDRVLLQRARTGVHDPDAPGGTDSGFSPADIPLLDEAAELLGRDDRAERVAASRRQSAELAFAQGVLEIASGSEATDLDDEAEAEILSVGDLLDAEALAERYRFGPDGSIAERAAGDRTWTYGHVLVDEAQELSAMAWRALMRRCPSRSMTLVGDLAQTATAAGATAWAPMLSPWVGDRWRRERLTVNYRTPAEIMAVAGDVLTALDPDATPPRSVRHTGVAPWRREVTEERLPAELARVAAEEDAAAGSGRLAVLVPDDRRDELGAIVRKAVPDAHVGAPGLGLTDLSSRTVVLGVGQAKGLEFDRVVVVDPAAILAGSPRGHSDLYVALTRPTQRLGILHPGPAPAVVTRAEPR